MIKEEDIRKRDALVRYLELVAADCSRMFPEEKLQVVVCPACQSRDSQLEFRKQGFEYHTCRLCQTLYARTRPAFADLEQFYTQSTSTDFWINDFFKPVAAVRRQKIFRPRAEYIAGRFGADPAWRIGDIGAGFGIFCEELKRLWPASSYVAIEPSPEQADICRKAGLEVVQSTVEAIDDQPDTFDLLTAFELLEHLHEPRCFLASVRRLLKPGGWLLMTSLNGLGFDIQVLWQNNKNIYPPCHINFFTPGSIQRLMEQSGFKVQEVSTPGQLDWDIVEGAIKHRDAEAGRFWKVVAEHVDTTGKHDLQNWIQRNALSSHMRILVQRV